MDNTLVVQSHRTPLPYHWIQTCLDSVRSWCELNEYEYRFVGDELFDYLPDRLLEKTQHKVVASDLARILLLQDALKSGYKTVIWLDADFLIFNLSEFVIPDQSYAVGREVWVQQDEKGKLKVYKKVHNAFLMFRSGNSFLEFYIETAERLLSQNLGTMPPQFIGPKLLTALHNVSLLPVMNAAGMLSPIVIKAMLQGEGMAMDLFLEHSPQLITGANLCVSSCEKKQVSDKQMERLIDALKKGVISVSK